MSTIKRQLTSGIFYTAMAKYSVVVVTIVVGAILARLLTPEDFGIVAIVMVFITFFNILSDFGIGPAVIQNKSLSKKDIQSVFSFSIIISLVLAAIFFFSSSVTATFYQKFELVSITKLLSLAVLFYSLRVVPNALMLKKLDFKLNALINIFIQIISGTIAIVLAYKGFSFYALVFKSIIDSLLSFLILYYYNPILVVLKIDRNSIKKIINFSTFQFLFNFINYFSRNSDNLLIGKFLSPTILGFYDKSYQLMMMPIQTLTNVITRVLHPVLSEFQNDMSKIYETYMKVVKILAIIGFPLSVFLFFSAEDLILILYGSQWIKSVPVFQILSMTVGIQMVLSSSGSIFQASNRTDLLFMSGFLSSIVMVVVICYGVFVGKSIEIIAYGLIVAFSINFFQGFYVLIRMVLKKSFHNFLKLFVFPLFVSCVIGFALWINTFYIIQNQYISLLLKILVAGVTYFLILSIKVEYRKVFINSVKRIVMSFQKFSRKKINNE